MEIAIISPLSIKLKGKTATFIVDPSDKAGKTEADAVLLTSKTTEANTSKIEGLRLSIKGEGEYEIGGVKISAIDAEGELVYSGDMDGGRFVLGTSAALSKALSKLDETPILIINASSDFNSTIVSTLSPVVTILYGSGTPEALKALGKENVTKVSKYVVKGDKLPEEAEVVCLE